MCAAQCCLHMTIARVYLFPADSVSPDALLFPLETGFSLLVEEHSVPCMFLSCCEQ